MNMTGLMKSIRNIMREDNGVAPALMAPALATLLHAENRKGAYIVYDCIAFRRY